MSSKKNISTPEKLEQAKQSHETIMGGFLLSEHKIDSTEWEDKSLPPVIKPKDFKPGQVLVGEIREVTKVKVDKTTNKLGALCVIMTVGGVCAVPVTAVLERALEVEGVGTENPTCPLVGRTVSIQATGQVKSNTKAHRDFWNFNVKVKK